LDKSENAPDRPSKGAGKKRIADGRRRIKIGAMFGLPPSTTFVAFGIPLLLIIGLLWWGIKFPPKKEEERNGDSGNFNP
jgi:hypothetical protein